MEMKQTQRESTNTIIIINTCLCDQRLLLKNWSCYQDNQNPNRHRTLTRYQTSNSNLNRYRYRYPNQYRTSTRCQNQNQYRNPNPNRDRDQSEQGKGAVPLQQKKKKSDIAIKSPLILFFLSSCSCFQIRTFCAFFVNVKLPTVHYVVHLNN